MFLGCSYPAPIAGLPRTVGRLELFANIAGVVDRSVIVLELDSLFGGTWGRR